MQMDENFIKQQALRRDDEFNILSSKLNVIRYTLPASWCWKRTINEKLPKSSDYISHLSGRRSYYAAFTLGSGGFGILRTTIKEGGFFISDSFVAW